MPSAKSLIGYAPILLVAVAMIMFVPVAVTASQSVAPQNHVTWHVLRLAHGWESVPKDGLRLPSYGTNGTGVVFLAGEVTPFGSVGGGKPAPYIAVLPKELRPAHNLTLLAVGPTRDVQGTEIPAEIDVPSNGKITLAGGDFLSGLSFVIGE